MAPAARAGGKFAGKSSAQVVPSHSQVSFWATVVEPPKSTTLSRDAS